MPTSAALDRWGRLPDACRELQRGAALPLQTVHAGTVKGAAMRPDCLCDCLLLLVHAQMQLPASGTWDHAELADNCCRVAHKKEQEFFETPTGELSQDCQPRIKI